MYKQRIVVGTLVFFLMLPILLTAQHTLQTSAHSGEPRAAYMQQTVSSPSGLNWLMPTREAADTGEATPVEEPLPVKETPKLTVAIDAGHGGNDPGAEGSNGRDEKAFTLSLAMKVAALLEKDEHVSARLIRSEDTYIAPRDRAVKANEMEADLFISIHTNSYEDARVRGTETYYHHPESKAFAELMHDRVLQATGFPDREAGRRNYIVIRETHMVSALLEIGYISNPKEEVAMFDDDMQDRIAAAIASGIQAYGGESTKPNHSQ